MPRKNNRKPDTGPMNTARVYSTMISVNLSPLEKRAMKVIADQRNLTVAACVRRALFAAYRSEIETITRVLPVMDALNDDVQREDANV